MENQGLLETYRFVLAMAGFLSIGAIATLFAI